MDTAKLIAAFLGSLVTLLVVAVALLWNVKLGQHQIEVQYTKIEGDITAAKIALEGRLNKHDEKLSEQSKTDDILVDQMIKALEAMHVHPDKPKQDLSGQQ